MSSLTERQQEAVTRLSLFLASHDKLQDARDHHRPDEIYRIHVFEKPGILLASDLREALGVLMGHIYQDGRKTSVRLSDDMSRQYASLDDFAGGRMKECDQS